VKITLNSFANIRDVLGRQSMPIDLAQGARLADLFEYLVREYGETFDRQIRDQLSRTVVPFLILINEKTYRSTSDMDAPLSDGDVVTFMIPFDGG